MSSSWAPNHAQQPGCGPGPAGSPAAPRGCPCSRRWRRAGRRWCMPGARRASTRCAPAWAGSADSNVDTSTACRVMHGVLAGKEQTAAKQFSHHRTVRRLLQQKYNPQLNDPPRRCHRARASAPLCGPRPQQSCSRRTPRDRPGWGAAAPAAQSAAPPAPLGREGLPAGCKNSTHPAPAAAEGVALLQRAMEQVGGHTEHCTQAATAAAAECGPIAFWGCQR